MAKLSSKGRKRMKSKQFALPGKRYPVHDLAHARNAAARVSQHGTAKEKKAVARKIKSKFPALAKRSSFVKKTLKKGRSK